MQPEKFRPSPVGAKDFSPLRTTVGRCFYGLKNQQDELRVRRVRHAHHVFPRHRMRSRPPSLACACREHRGTVQRRMILLGAHGAPYRRWSRVAEAAAFLHADFATAWIARFAVRIVPQRFEERRVGPSLLPFGDGVWRAGGGRLDRVRAVVPAGQSLADGSAPFFTRFALRAALAFSLETGAPFGEGGRSHRAGPGPILSRQADSR